MDVLTVLEDVGIFAFALSGALVALRRGLDLVGLVALALVTGFAGGVVRDLLVGDVPPQVLQDNLHLMIPLGAAALTVAVPSVLDRFAGLILFLDAIGLGLFAAAGAAIALEAGLPVLPTILVGTTSAVGGGLLRDLLAGEVPQILAQGSRLYAVPAALGSSIVVIGDRASFEPSATQVAAAVVTLVLRMLALHYGWHAPIRARSASSSQPGG